MVFEWNESQPRRYKAPGKEACCCRARERERSHLTHTVIRSRATVAVPMTSFSSACPTFACRRRILRADPSLLSACLSRLHLTIHSQQLRLYILSIAHPFLGILRVFPIFRSNRSVPGGCANEETFLLDAEQYLKDPFYSEGALDVPNHLLFA